MSLTKRQVKELEGSINGYSFPPVYCDFDKQSEMVEKSMKCLEGRVRDILNSDRNDQLKNGLANVVFWGMLMRGIKCVGRRICMVVVFK